MGPNCTDNAPASEAELAGDERERQVRNANLPRARVGRPTRLTYALQEKLVAAVRAVG
jgi:hypothetical protein